MDASQMEFAEHFRRESIRLLRRHSRVEREGRCWIQLATFPSFGPMVCVTVPTAPGGRVVQVQWDAPNDLDKIADPVSYVRLRTSGSDPSISVRYAKPNQDLTDAAALLLDASIGLSIADSHAGLDGTTYELAVVTGLSSMILRWWERVPTAWKAVDIPISNLRRCIAKLNVWESSEPRHPPEWRLDS